MNLESYKEIIKSEVRRIEVAGKTHYFKLPGYLDVDLFSVMKDESLEQPIKMLHCLAAVICDEDGQRVFDISDEEHCKIIKALPNELQIALINNIAEVFFPKESKAQV